MAIGAKAKKVFDEVGDSMSGAVRDFIGSIDKLEQRIKALEDAVYGTSGASGESGTSGTSGESGTSGASGAESGNDSVG